MTKVATSLRPHIVHVMAANQGRVLATEEIYERVAALGVASFDPGWQAIDGARFQARCGYASTPSSAVSALAAASPCRTTCALKWTTSWRSPTMVSTRCGTRNCCVPGEGGFRMNMGELREHNTRSGVMVDERLAVLTGRLLAQYHRKAASAPTGGGPALRTGHPRS